MCVPQLCSRLTAEHPQHRSNLHQSPGAAQRPTTPAATGSPDRSAGSTELQQQIDDLKVQLEDVQQQLETTHTDANNTIGMLRDQLSEARSATAAARGDAAQVQIIVCWELQRSSCVWIFPGLLQLCMCSRSRSSRSSRSKGT